MLAQRESFPAKKKKPQIQTNYKGEHKMFNDWEKMFRKCLNYFAPYITKSIETAYV